MSLSTCEHSHLHIYLQEMQQPKQEIYQHNNLWETLSLFSTPACTSMPPLFYIEVWSSSPSCSQANVNTYCEQPIKLSKNWPEYPHYPTTFSLKAPEPITATFIDLVHVFQRSLNCSNTAVFNLCFLFLPLQYCTQSICIYLLEPQIVGLFIFCQNYRGQTGLPCPCFHNSSP